MFADLAKRTKYMDPALAGRWVSLAGDKIVGLARPGRLTGGRTGRTLEIHVANGAAAAAVQMETDGLISRLNTHFGPGAVARIAVIQTGGEPARPSDLGRTANVPEPEDPALGEALASFRAALSRRDREKNGKNSENGAFPRHKPVASR